MNFLLDNNKCTAITLTPNTFLGPIVNEVHQTFSNWASQVIRQYADEDYVEVEWLVGPIPIDDNKGKEIVAKYTTDLKSNGVFWTDSSGRETIQRKRDFRPTWDLDIQEPVAGIQSLFLKKMKKRHSRS